MQFSLHLATCGPKIAKSIPTYQNHFGSVLPNLKNTKIIFIKFSWFVPNNNFFYCNLIVFIKSNTAPVFWNNSLSGLSVIFLGQNIFLTLYLTFSPMCLQRYIIQPRTSLLAHTNIQILWLLIFHSIRKRKI